METNWIRENKARNGLSAHFCISVSNSEKKVTFTNKKYIYIYKTDCHIYIYSQIFNCLIRIKTFRLYISVYFDDIKRSAIFYIEVKRSVQNKKSM